MKENLLWGKDVSVIEKYFEVSDGVQIKIFDIFPPYYAPKTPIIVFVAGWISLLKGWENVLKVLSLKFRIIYIETREKSSANLPSGKAIDFSIERMSLDIDEILSRILTDKDPLYFVGSSLGATVIFDYLSVNQDKLPLGSFLISPICEFPFPSWLLFIIKFVPASLYTLVRPILKGYLKYFHLDRKNESEQIKKYEGTIDAAEPVRLKANAYAIKDYSLWEKLKNITTSVVVIGAETDNLHSVEELKKIVSNMSSACLELMKSNKETHSEKAGKFIVDQIEAV